MKFVWSSLEISTSYNVCITLLSAQLSFCGPCKYNIEMFKKLRRKIHIQIKLPTSHCHIMKAHVAEYVCMYVWAGAHAMLLFDLMHLNEICFGYLMT